MRIAKVIGKVVLSRCHETFQGANLKLAIPCSLENLAGESEEEGECIVLWDGVGAGDGSMIALSEGPEAAQPFRPEIKPVDAYAAGILDAVNLDKAALKQLKSAAKKNKS
jgi:ethanolamine utilization protein EutN